jgi:thiol-disulfide isomerase/thioredoxin
MRNDLRRSWTIALVGCLLGSAGAARAQERSANDILKDLDAVKLPSFEPARRTEQGYIQKLQKEFVEVGAKRDGLILELFKANPDNDRLPPLMAEHWQRVPPIGPGANKLDKEIDEVLHVSKNEKLKVEALFARARVGLIKGQQTGGLDLAGVEEFLKLAPHDPRGEQLLYMATFAARDDKVKESLEDRMLKDYPKSRYTEAIHGTPQQRAAVGKPFELEFTDAISGSTVSMKNLKGKVVVVDFWATWCGPCVNEMPHMKELYAKYRDKGVEFIGVSLDQPKEQGGLDALKKFVKDKEIGWPQYYQGKFWNGDFSRHWGINSIPAVFVVGPDGNLYSVRARGKLDRMIPELLKKKGEGVKVSVGGG